ncbi:YdbC family protein [Exiguobacterium sp. TDN 0502]|uniref:YdbC family protein n=1 Tax=Exiguobacterium sp. TDN 0502 TaxID=3420731 RepID=UPI003D77A832
MAEIKYEVVENIGVLSESSRDWKKELNRISWNGVIPKYDIREWALGREKMGKGVTLSQEEYNELQRLVKNI